MRLDFPVYSSSMEERMLATGQSSQGIEYQLLMAEGAAYSGTKG